MMAHKNFNFLHHTNIILLISTVSPLWKYSSAEEVVSNPWENFTGPLNLGDLSGLEGSHCLIIVNNNAGLDIAGSAQAQPIILSRSSYVTINVSEKYPSALLNSI